MKTIGSSVQRIDAVDKARGKTKYTEDKITQGCMYGKIVVSTEAHANIESIDIAEAMAIPGVRAVLTGQDCPELTGSQVEDMPILAQGIVRYYGEPVALVVAEEEWQAVQGAALVNITYSPLPIVNDVDQGVLKDAPLVHPNMLTYKHASDAIYPIPGTNILNHTKIRKGNMDIGWAESEVVVEGKFKIPQTAHCYMENRTATAEIMGDGSIVIEASSQAPQGVKELIKTAFKLNEGRINIKTSYVGGSYGGKVNAHPAMLAYIASRAVEGKKVSVSYTREQCFTSTGSRMGVSCTFKMGAKEDGKIVALEAVYHMDTGAYADTGPRMSMAAATSTGEPYDIPNIKTDALCVYTNHTYSTSYRGFGHDTSTFCMERMMDKMAKALAMDPAEFRRLNLSYPGATSPTGVLLNLSNFGNPTACLDRVVEMIKWNEGAVKNIGKNKVRAKGLSMICKTSSSPTDASSGAIITFNGDGSINLNCGAIECGQGFFTAMRQIAAEKFKMSPDRVFIAEELATRTSPHHWKTVASMSTYLAGNAVMQAAEDAICQLKSIGAVALRCREDDLEVGEERVYLRSDPSIFMAVKDLAAGIKYENGNAFGQQIIGRGSYIMEHLSKLDRETGQGRPGPFYTVGAQGVEIEYDTKECSMRLIRAITAIDAGKVINAELARGQVTGAMNMGLSEATREGFIYNDRGQLQNSSLRTYKVMHFAENAKYDVAFIEIPNLTGPYGARGLGEHGILGMAPALANALANATGKEMDELPLRHEKLWELAKGGE